MKANFFISFYQSHNSQTYKTFQSQVKFSPTTPKYNNKNTKLQTTKSKINNKTMPRTLGPSNGDQDSNQVHDQDNEPFFLKNQLPMFLAQSADGERANSHDEDIAKCKELIQRLCDSQLKTQESLEDIAALIKQQKDLTKAMGYFSAKNLVFLEYLMQLKLYELFRINGKSVTSGNGLELYQRLAYLKTLLLKLQPVEKKLDYQKNKILKHSDKVTVTKEVTKEESGQQENNDEVEENNIKDEEIDLEEDEQQEDEMAFKPRPSALMKIKHEKDTRLLNNDKYQAPKISSNLSKEDKLRQRMERQKQIRKIGLIRRLQSDLIDDDRAQERFLGDEINERFKRKFQQKISYEEDAFTRLPDSKKDKFYMKQMVRNSMRKSQLDEDLKEVQMVRQLFDNENKMQHKIKGGKQQKEGKFKSQSNDRENHKNDKTKHIKKQNKK